MPSILGEASAIHNTTTSAKHLSSASAGTTARLRLLSKAANWNAQNPSVPSVQEQPQVVALLTEAKREGQRVVFSESFARQLGQQAADTLQALGS